MKLYLDASALVKLLIREDETALAAALWLEADRVVSAATIALEARAAVARRLSGPVAVRAVRDLARRVDVIELREVDADLLSAASATAAQFRLRALDALHLAAAVQVADETLVFATWDRELSQAASRAGLAVAP